VKALHVSPFSQYRVANEEQEWIGRSILIAPGRFSEPPPSTFAKHSTQYPLFISARPAVAPYLFANDCEENFSSMRGTTMFEKENALPGSELHFAIYNGHGLAGAC
jgi:hypothetical protein